MLRPDPLEWSLWIHWLYAFGAWYLAGFVYFWIRFTILERRLATGGKEAAEKFDDALRGFPNAFYAKMMGKTRAGEKRPGDSKRSTTSRGDYQ